MEACKTKNSLINIDVFAKLTIKRYDKNDSSVRGLFKKYPTFLYKAHNTINFASFIQSPSKYSPWWFTHLS